jgi:hypothetical protein
MKFAHFLVIWASCGQLLGCRAAQQPRDTLDLAALWEAHRAGEAETVVRAVDGCLESANEFERGQCMFLKGDSLRQLGKFDEAPGPLMDAAKEDIGWLDGDLRPVQLAQFCGVSLTLVEAKNRATFPASACSLAESAWSYYRSGRYELAITLARQCIDMNLATAISQQSQYSLSELSGVPAIVAGSPRGDEVATMYGVLNGVGTAYYVIMLASLESAATAGTSSMSREFATAGLDAFASLSDQTPGARLLGPGEHVYRNLLEVAKTEVPALEWFAKR